MATKKRNGAKAKVAEAAAEYRTHALGEVVWLAYRALSEEDKEVFFKHLLADPELREDLMDTIIAMERRNEPTRPYREVREEMIREGLL